MRTRLFAPAAAALLVSATPAWAADEQPMAQEMDLSTPVERPVLKQKDEPWRFVRLGEAYWVSKHGCAVFALRDALEEWGYAHEPLVFIEMLKAADLLTREGALDFRYIERIHPELRSERIRPEDGEVSLERALAAREHSLVLLRYRNGEGVHWVFLSPRKGFGGYDVARDSMFGTVVPLMAYNDRTLDGMVIISKNPEPVLLASNE